MNLSRFPKQKAVESYPPPPPDSGGDAMRAESALGAFRFGPLAAALLLAFGLLLLLAVAAPAGAQTGTNDYDPDDDRLIDIDTHEKFNAIRHDLDGDGISTHATYTAAFPNPDTAGQCPTSCQGYELTDDISLSSYSNWTPIGGAYAAVFDGKGHTISGLTITANTSDDAGLFGQLTSAGRITRVGVAGANITGTASSNQELGILVGESHGVIRFSYTTGTVTSATSGTWHKTGGLVGHLNGGGSISASYSTATVAGPTTGGIGQATGGLVGYVGESAGTDTGTVTAAYASGAVSGVSSSSSYLGGLIGYLRRGSVNQSYSYGSVTPSTSHVTNAGGLIGNRQTTNSSVNNSYYDSTTSGRSDTGRGGPEPTADLQNPLDYTGTIFSAWDVNVDGVAGNDDPWDFGTASQYPALQVDFDDDGTASAYEFGVAYDANGNSLIDIDSAAKLIAIRHDLNGDGLQGSVSASDWSSYTTAFPDAVRGLCPTSCQGYELTADITLTAAWTPTGAYTATFDGGGHSISGLSVSHGNDSGMFGSIGGSAIIRDLRLIAPTIAQTGTGARSSGALVGYINTGTTILISSVSVEGGSVTTTSNNSNVGGLVGYIRSGTIRASWSSATAGLSGSPTGVDAGGLMGEQGAASVIASYARGAASGQTNGGFVGRVSVASAVITNGYCVASSGDCFGGVVGGGPEPRRYTAAQMQAPTGYTGIFLNWNIDLDSDSDLDYPWDFGTSSDYPTLNTPTQRATATPAATDFDATDNGLIDISTAAQLNAVRWDLNGDGDPDAANSNAYGTAFGGRQHTADADAGRMGCPLTGCTGYELTADISLADYANWTPIGTDSARFVTQLDGNGHTIANLTIGTAMSGNTDDKAGLFGMMDTAGSILRVGVTGANVYGGAASSQELGILVGESRGTIRFSYVTGQVTADADGAFHKTGGMVGHLREGGTISASYSTAAVNGPTTAANAQVTGGLVGQLGGAANSNTGTITAAYASGAVGATVDATNGYLGGLVGYNFRGDINQSYAYGSVSPSLTTTHSGGLLGRTENDGNETDSYYDSTTTTQSDTGKGVGYPTADLQSPLAYAGTIYANWDVNVDGVAGDDDPWDFGTASQYPALKIDFNNDGTDSAYEFGVQGRSEVAPPPSGNGNGGRPSVAPPARGGGQPYNPAADHPEIYANPRYEMAATCAVRTTGAGDQAITTSTLTFDLGNYTRPITLALSLWDGTHYRSLQSLGLNMPAFQRDGQTATVEVVTDPAQTRFRLDGQYGLNLVLGYADCRTDDP